MATNRFTQRQENKESLNEQEILLNILRSEFPNDPLYSQGVLTPTQLQATAFTPTFAINRAYGDISYTKRNDKNTLDTYSGVKEFTEYKVDKVIPTIDENSLDDLLDDEWSYFLKEDVLRQPATSGVFIIPTEQQLNPSDYHDAYINHGPERLTDVLANNNTADSITSQIFCVYFVNNDVAYPIPNYKTLEVMLVERGLTYDAITEASAEQLKQFDMSFDGKFEGDQTPNTAADPIEEFNFRKLPDRTIDWSIKVRYDSGYKPKAPFVRDPGDYLKPANYTGVGTSDLFIEFDPSDRYFDLVFQRQTYKEALREKYEGKMVIRAWPVPFADSIVLNRTELAASDDLVYEVRMMINGYWKQVIDLNVFRLYATLNNYDISAYDVISENTITYTNPFLYGETGIINLLVNAGGIEPLQVNDDDPIWNDFPHIIEVDRLDLLEYQQYVDYYSNGRNPFDVEQLKPCEPAGSILYYQQARLDLLQQQAANQDQFDSIQAQIYEYWPKLATRIEELNNRLVGAIQGTYKDYFERRFGNNCPSYMILTASEPWKYVKKKKKELKVKDEHTNLLALYENNSRISANFSSDDEAKIVSTGRWGVTVKSDIVNSWGNNGGTIPYTTISFNNSIRSLMNYVGNQNQYDLPRQGGVARRKDLMREYTYTIAMIHTELKSRFDSAGILTRIADADELLKELREAIIEATDLLLSIDGRLIAATTVTELQDIYNSIMDLYTFTSSISSDELQYCIDTQYEIDKVFRNHLNDLYNSVEYMRKRVNEEIGNKGKFGIQWPESARSIINSYLGSKSFDNYLPENED
jgi:hypothetical protein